MKKAGVISASVAAAASSMALGSKSDRHVSIPHDSNEVSWKKIDGSGSTREEKKEKFTPKFDGLRFIEMLVTAHR